MMTGADPKQPRVICAKFGSTHGVRGAIKVFSDTDPKEALLDYSPWWIQTREGWEPFHFSNPKITAKYILVTPKDCTDCDMAQAYVNKDIGILREQFSDTEDGSYYWADIIGCSVYNMDGSLLGKIVEIMDHADNDIFVIKKPDGKRLLIPHTDPFVTAIDIANKRIDVHWEEI
jgi:16S rRNA processing protein RimM